MRRSRGVLAMTFALLAVPAGALAQDSQLPADVTLDQEARSIFQAGAAALDAGRLEDALGYFERAYRLSHRAALLYNVGTTASALGRNERAIQAFEQFLREDPATDRRADVTGRLEALRAAVAAERAPARAQEPQPRPLEPPAQPHEPPSDATSRGPGVAPWIVIGVSGAAVVTGGVLFGLGLSAESDFESAPEGSAWPQVSGDYDRATTFTTLGVVLGAVGLVGAAAGLVWVVAGSGPGERSEGVRASVGLGGVSLEGRF